MKIGQEIPVSLEGHAVAYAIVEEIDGERVTLVIPQTRVVMGLRSSLVAPTPEVDREMTALTETNDDSPSPAAQEQIAGNDEPVSLKQQEHDSSAID